MCIHLRSGKNKSAHIASKPPGRLTQMLHLVMSPLLAQHAVMLIQRGGCFVLFAPFGISRAQVVEAFEPMRAQVPPSIAADFDRAYGESLAAA